MSTTLLDKQIALQSKDTGIPARELRRMCMQAGLEQLQKGELTIKARPAVKRKSPAKSGRSKAG